MASGRLQSTPPDQGTRALRVFDVVGDVGTRPLLAVVTIVVTAVRWPYSDVVLPDLALPLFVVTAVLALVVVSRWNHVGQRFQVAVLATYAACGAVLHPLAHATVGAALFPYLACGACGFRIRSVRLAVGIAVTAAAVSAGALWLVGRGHAGTAQQWPWWVGLTVGLPVYMGIARRYRAEALESAQHAAVEARRAAAADAHSAALEERGRIAREVHDVVGHSLSGIALQLDLAETLYQRDRGDDAMVAVRRARTLAVDSIAETRSAVHALRDGAPRVTDALRAMAETYGARLDIVGDPAGLDPETAHTIVRVAQEALTNAAKHASGSVVDLRFEAADEALVLTVRNSLPTGVSTAAHDHGIGLAGMTERVALLGGSLRAGPTGSGTWEVRAVIPR